MAKRVTIERVLRDDDDTTGQSVRDWKMQIEQNTIIVKSDHGTNFILLGVEDVPLFIADLQQAAKLAKEPV